MCTVCRSSRSSPKRRRGTMSGFQLSAIRDANQNIQVLSGHCCILLRHISVRIRRVTKGSAYPMPDPPEGTLIYTTKNKFLIPMPIEDVLHALGLLEILGLKKPADFSKLPPPR